MFFILYAVSHFMEVFNAIIVVYSTKILCTFLKIGRDNIPFFKLLRHPLLIYASALVTPLWKSKFAESLVKIHCCVGNAYLLLRSRSRLKKISFINWKSHNNITLHNIKNYLNAFKNHLIAQLTVKVFVFFNGNPWHWYVNHVICQVKEVLVIFLSQFLLTRPIKVHFTWFHSKKKLQNWFWFPRDFL